MICANPECGCEFESGGRKQLYCCHRCRNRVTVLKALARKRAKSQASTHPCHGCGAPIKYARVRLLYCPKCQEEQAKGTGPGVGPLNTSNIKKARQHEMDMIEKVVAKAKAKDTLVGIDTYSEHWTKVVRGVRVG